MDGYRLHVATYSHRHGIDVRVYWVKAGVEFDEEEAIKLLGDMWEGEGTEADRDDEHMDVVSFSDQVIPRVES